MCGCVCWGEGVGGAGVGEIVTGFVGVHVCALPFCHWNICSCDVHVVFMCWCCA